MKKFDHLIMYTDGASRKNPGDSGIGILIKDQTGNIIDKISKYIGRNTNNEAEYKALITALQVAKRYDPKRIEILSDSELMVRQMNGIYRVKSENILRLFNLAKGLIKDKKVTFRHIPREENQEADRLCNEAIDRKLK